MKRLLFLPLVLLLLLFFPSYVFAQDTGWVIHSFDSALSIQTDGRVAVDEKISVDFNSLSKHGIYRDIPNIYQDTNGQQIYTSISSVQVRQDGYSEQYSSYQNGNYLEIKIGNPHMTISGIHVYEINYTVSGVLKSYSDHDELYWNMTGGKWPVTIEKATSSLTLSKPGLQKVSCFEGVYGSTTPCASSQKDTVVSLFAATRVLNPGEGVTIVAGFQKGLFPILVADKPKNKIDQLFSLMSIAIFAITALLGIVSVFFLWMRKGRDLWQGGNPIVPQKTSTEPLMAHESTVVEYIPPENLRPAEIGVLIDEKADTLDVTATIIDLASRGYLSIHEKEKSWMFGSRDFTLTKIKKDTTELLSYEQYLLDQLFEAGESIDVSSLKQVFYTSLQEVKNRLYQDVVDKGFFSESPEKRRGFYHGIAIVIIVIGTYGAFNLASESAYFISLGLGVVLSGAALFFASFFISRRTAQGHELYRRIKGYRLFISSAETYRQKFFERENMFNEVLPYAIVFGLTEKFAKAMDQIGLKPPQPSWYYGTYPFSAYYFGSSMHSFSSSFGQAIAAAPKSSGFSSGGGFSGGGFGGGGGGSW